MDLYFKIGFGIAVLTLCIYVYSERSLMNAYILAGIIILWPFWIIKVSNRFKEAYKRKMRERYSSVKEENVSHESE